MPYKRKPVTQSPAENEPVTDTTHSTPIKPENGNTVLELIGNEPAAPEIPQQTENMTQSQASNPPAVQSIKNNNENQSYQQHADPASTAKLTSRSEYRRGGYGESSADSRSQGEYRPRNGGGYHPRNPEPYGATQYSASQGAGRSRYERDRYETGEMNTPTEEVKGYLDVQPEGHGFLRPKFIPSQRDIYISQSQIRRFQLRPGDLVTGIARPPKDTERYYGLLKVEKVNGTVAEEATHRPWFDDLTPIYPKKQLILASGKKPISTRIIDLVAPIGFGQRGMIVSPPKAGKTTIMKEIAAGITNNFPDVHLMAALIGERPEEVTDISMSVKGEVVASNFDEPPDHQTRVAEIALERAKRMVELGKDVVVLLDSITRLARAYNLSVESSGRTLSGGFDPAALWPAKRFFGAARNCQEGGSLTIIGTALVETGSRMDDLIYEEFKGTGNMELHLERKLADRRIYPAINIERSGTRQEELLLSEDDYKKVVIMRRMMDLLNPDERTLLFIEKLAETDNNEAFLNNLGKV